VNATDDSIIKVISEQPLLIRRSRGFVPESVAIRSRVTTPLLALGAEMNSTFALFDGHGRITLSQHLGNLTHPASFTHYQATLKHFLAYTHISPAVILCDLHPEYQTSIYGQQLAQAMGVPLISIQHHRAHAAGAALEHDLKDFTAIVCDGLGYGDDGTLWGGEVFDHHTRIGHLELHPPARW
jgi:hydrogenase maturation protein HypF